MKDQTVCKLHQSPNSQAEKQGGQITEKEFQVTPTRSSALGAAYIILLVLEHVILPGEPLATDVADGALVRDVLLLGVCAVGRVVVAVHVPLVGRYVVAKLVRLAPDLLSVVLLVFASG